MGDTPPAGFARGKGKPGFPEYTMVATFDIPRPLDSGSHANQWVLPLAGARPRLLPESQWEVLDRPRYYFLVWRIDLKAGGTGSNTWLLEPVTIDDHSAHFSDWTLGPFPEGAGDICPLLFDDTELRYESVHAVSRALSGVFGVRFDRWGAGTHELEVTVWANR